MHALPLSLLLLGLPASAALAADSVAISVTLELESTGKPSIDKAISERTVAVIKKRFELLGLEGATFGNDEDGRLVVALPSGAETKEALRLMTKPSAIEFRRVVEDPTMGGTETLYEYVRTGDGEIRRNPYVLEKEPFLTGKDIEQSSVLEDPQFHAYSVDVQLKPEGAETFERVTGESLGKRLAIVVDGHIVSAPLVQMSIAGGRLQVTGQFTDEEARDLAISLNSGPLPGRVKLVEQPTVQAPTRPSDVVRSDVDEFPDADAKPRPGRYAVVIGVQDYRQKLHSADFARRDALSVAEHLTRIMGFPRENVVTLVDEHAAKSDMEKYLEVWLKEKAVPGTTAFVYYSGHGAPDAASGDTYLVPYDGDPAFISKTGYPLKSLYRLASELRAARTILAIDACFSGSGDRSVAPKGARPLVIRVDPSVPISGKTVVLSAAGPSQMSSTYQEQGHGVFTYFLLKGLRGAQDANGDGRMDTDELFEYLRPQVEYTARALYFNEQVPQMTAPSGPLIVKD